MYRILIITLLFNVIGYRLFPQSSSNNLVVYSESGRRFTLYMNGEKVNPILQANVKAFDLTEGWQRLRIEMENGTVLNDSLHIKNFTKNQNKEFTYVIKESPKKGKRQYTVFFVGMSDMSAPKVPVVPEVPVEMRVVDTIICGNLYGIKNNKPVFFTNYEDANGKCKLTLNEIDVNFATTLIKKTNDVQDKYKYAEAIVTKNCYSSEQLSQILVLLENEMDKLKLAKMGFPHVTDPANAARVNGSFKYASVKDNFTNFLKETKGGKSEDKKNCNGALNEKEFLMILSSVKQLESEYDRIKLAKKNAGINCFTTDQVKQIMEAFTHDREKFDFLKTIYIQITDKENTFLLENSFQFTESKREFLQFIEH